MGRRITSITTARKVNDLAVIMDQIVDLDLVDVIAGHPVGDVKDDVLDLWMGYGKFDHLIKCHAIFLFIPGRFDDPPGFDDPQVSAIRIVLPKPFLCI